MTRHFLLAFALLLPATAPAASFTLGAVLRAGDIFDDNMRLGSTSSGFSSSGGLFPFLIDGVDHTFRLSYNAATNTASLSLNWLGLFTSGISYVVAGGSPSSTPRIWSLGAGGISLSALNNSATNTSVSLQNLSISGPGMGVINPAGLVAAQTGAGAVTASNAAPITFTTPNGGGNWLLTGQVRFSGISGIGAAINDDLRVAFDLSASDVPEPESLLLSALGLAALGSLHHYRSARLNKLAAATAPQRPQV